MSGDGRDVEVRGRAGGEPQRRRDEPAPGRTTLIHAHDAPAGVPRLDLGKGGKPQPEAESWLRDEDALGQFVSKAAMLGYRGAIAPPDRTPIAVESIGRADADIALVQVHSAAQLARTVRNGGNAKQASLAFAQWAAARPLIDRALAAYASFGPGQDYRPHIAGVDRALAALQVEHDVDEAALGASFAGQDELLVAHKQIVIEAVERAKEACLKAREAAKEQEKRKPAETLETGKKAAETAHNAVAPGPGSVTDQVTKREHAAAGHVELEPASGAIREVGLEALDAVLLVLKAEDIGAALKNAKGPLEKVKAVGQLFEYAIDVAAATVSLTLDGVALAVRKSMPVAAEQLGKASSGLKNFKGTWVANAMRLFNVVTGTIDLVAAIRRGDTESAIRAGGTIANAVVGVGMQMMKMGGPFSAIMTIYLQEVVEAVIAIGRMGAALKQAATNRTIGNVATIAHRGVDLAQSAAALAQAWQGQQTAIAGNGDPAQALERAYAASVRRESEHIKVEVKDIAGWIGNLALDPTRGGVRDGAKLVASVGGAARAAMERVAHEDIEPFTLVQLCRDAVLPGVEHVVHTALQSGTMSADALMNGGLEQIAGR